jgi:uncharacterized phage protein (TIGR01671 family)
MLFCFYGCPLFIWEAVLERRKEMREIKFRAKHKKSGNWNYGSNNKKDSMSLALFFKQLFLDWNTLGQFTVLLDKNGKEIYEGDIVKCVEFFVAEIMIDPYQGVILQYAKSNKRVEIMGTYYEPIWRNHKTTIEVIGNIYENPQLLKG